MAARELSKARFLGPTRPVVNPVTGTVQTTVTQILKNNPDRVHALIVNLSPNPGYVGFDREVSATRGIPIAANGGFVILTIDEDGELVAQAVFAINTVLAGTYYIVEVERT